MNVARTAFGMLVYRICIERAERPALFTLIRPPTSESAPYVSKEGPSLLGSDAEARYVDRDKRV